MMEERTSVVRNIDRMSSIESEPRTLRMDQIHFAREAALYVLQTRSMEEAMRNFSEGLEPVVSIVGMNAGGTRLGMDLDNDEFQVVHHRPELKGRSCCSFLAKQVFFC